MVKIFYYSTIPISVQFQTELSGNMESLVHYETLHTLLTHLKHITVP